MRRPAGFSEVEWLARWRDVSGLSDRRQEAGLLAANDSRAATYDDDQYGGDMFDRHTTQLMQHSVELAVTVIQSSGDPELARDVFVRLLDQCLADHAEGAAMQRAIELMHRIADRSNR